MRDQEETYLSGNLTAMIDIVFQLIIFFVCTINLQDASVDSKIKLAMAPHGAEIKGKDPRTIYVDMDSSGRATICRIPVTPGILHNILKKAVNEFGQDVPVVIRADGNARHDKVQVVMDTCAGAGIWKIKMGALREKGS
jgi:biopolymer transport protein ExbD